VRPASPDLPRESASLTGIDLVIFDKDGTLIDFHAMWGGWVSDLGRDLAATTGSPIAEALRLRLGVDVSGRILAHGALAATPMARLRELVVEFLRERGSSAADSERAVASAWRPPDPLSLAHPLADLGALFSMLRGAGRRIAVATSDDRGPTMATLAGLGVWGLVDGIVCADDGVPVKPAPDMVLHLCRSLGVDPARAAMIGDTPADLQMGLAAGVGRRIGVLSGVGTRRELAPLADGILPSIASLLER
jgi:phosphoglycolate phosphatase-like HAD superfamily hydrolase